MIEGIPYAMSPQPRPEHQAIATNTAAEFRAVLKKNECNCKVYQPIDYKISEETILNPDILICCKPIKKAFLDFSPDLVVEIISPATALKDRHYKFEIYQQQKISFYLIVDIDARLVDVFKLENDRYEKQDVILSDPYQFVLSNCDFEIVFDNIWS